ncbi:hypothetical protein FUAX_21410 [Fulvitalea axinellae]|uniref:Uncharacterized protein n=1 Tax=Fulvitalea axinellae TaxID=1182444 RepID=A0AAU9D5G0_9BACT|nr:hypothetical protein FUAX_21410 [Fulvitalea axinellae]
MKRNIRFAGLCLFFSVVFMKYANAQVSQEGANSGNSGYPIGNMEYNELESDVVTTSGLGGDGDTPPGPKVPIDGGVTLLVGAGVALGYRTLKNKKASMKK